MSKVNKLENDEDKFIPGETHNTNDLLAPSEPKTTKRKKTKNQDDEEDKRQTQEFSEDRARVINKIKLYKENFPSSCSLVDIGTLSYMDDDELDEYLYNIRTVVSNRNNTNMVETGINGAILGFETIAKTYYPKLEGLHSQLSMKQAYNDCLKEIAIEHCNLGYVRPEIRLMMLVSGCAAQRLAQPDVINKPIESSEAKKYDNL